MPFPYRQPHWSALADTISQRQKSVGDPPKVWASRLNLPNIPNSASLSANPLDRVQVATECTDPAKPVLFGYICAMAWGGQDRVRSGVKNAQNAWTNSAIIALNLQQLRAGGLTRKAAYQLFEGKGKVPGLGASFFTKLLFFFTINPIPGQEPYIVDNVILDGMALLTGLPFNSFATRGGYQACCEELDEMGVRLGCNGSQMEERIFGPWRSYLSTNSEAIPSKVLSAHYRQTMHQAYPHIPISDF